jgi:N-acyl homoserine lactone hydrolase
MVAARIVPLEIGRLDTDLATLTGDQERMIMPVPAWLIEHSDGLVLFDTGMHRDLQHDTTRSDALMASTFIDFPEGEELGARIIAAGYLPEDIDVVVVSHLHYDHAGGIGEVPNARLVVQRPEWEAGHHPKLIAAQVYDPGEFDIGHDVQLIEGDHDVLGDGSITCVSTPGHTRGHQALRVDLPSGPVVLTADCIYFAAMLEEMRVPVFGFDRELQLDSMRRLATMRSEGCRLLFGHDPDQFNALPSILT